MQSQSLVSTKKQISTDDKSSFSLITKKLRKEELLQGDISNERKKYLDELVATNVDKFLRAAESIIINNDLTNADYIYLILHDGIQNKIRHAAYLGLIRSGKLKDLQQLSSRMDFDYLNSNRHDAVEIACFHGRIEVLRWLARSVAMGGCGLELDDRLCKDAVSTGQIELLYELVKPIESGGFGLSLSVRSTCNYDLAMYAVYHGQGNMLAELVTPIAMGGFGFVIDKDVLRNHPYSLNQTSLQYPPYVMAFHPKDCTANDVSKLIIVDIKAKNVESFSSTGKIGEGSYGSVFNYTSKQSGRNFAVKSMHTGWELFKYEMDYNMSKQHTLKEYKLLCRAYPDDGPYMWQEMRNRFKDQAKYSFVLAMPFREGRLVHVVCEESRSAREIATIFLWVAHELHCMHERGVIHGDIRPGNVLINMISADEMKVWFIDFGFSYKLGREIFRELNDVFYAPEMRNKLVMGHASQDIWSLTKLFTYLLENKINDVVKDELDKEYPVINNFIKSSLNENPSLRPTLPDFLGKLSSELEAKNVARMSITQ